MQMREDQWRAWREVFALFNCLFLSNNENKTDGGKMERKSDFLKIRLNWPFLKKANIFFLILKED